MSSENLYERLKRGEIEVKGISEKPAPSHPGYRSRIEADDVYFPYVEVRTKSNENKKQLNHILDKLFKSGRKIVKAQALLPPHMQGEYSFGKSAETTDCYEAAIMFTNPDYKPKIRQDYKAFEKFSVVYREDATTGDLWELFNPYREIVSFDTEGDTTYDQINHCAVILTPGDLVWSKNGSGLWAGLFLTSMDRVFALYDSLRINKKIETPYEHRFWRYRS